MKAKTKRRLKNTILEAITATEFMLMLIGMAGMDSPDVTAPIIITVQAMIWLGLFSLVNPDYGKEED